MKELDLKSTYLNLWDAYFKTSFVFDGRRDTVWREVCRFIQKKYVPQDSRILDVGAGYCNFINNIRGREKHAVDIFSRLPEYAHKDVVVHHRSCMDLHDLDGSYFDVIFASNLFEHLSREDLLRLLPNLRRILRDRGRLIVLQPNFRYCSASYFDDYTHLQIFTDRGLSELIEAHGFRIADVMPRLLPINMKTTLRVNLPLLPLIVRSYLHSPIRPKAAQMLIVADKDDGAQAGAAQD